MIPSHAKATASIVWMIGVVAAAPVLAQEARDEAESPEDRAYALFQESVQKYREGRFEEAAALLEEANRLDPDPILVYNLARAYEGMGDFDEAVSAYEQYLREAPDAADRGAVEARVETLNRQLRERRELLSQSRANGESGGEGGIGPAPLFLLGLGGAAVGVGVVFGVLSNRAHQDAIDAPDFTSAYASQEDSRELATGANVAFAVGGVALLVGTAWLVLDWIGDDPDEPRIDGSLGPDGAGLSVAQAW